MLEQSTVKEVAVDLQLGEEFEFNPFYPKIEARAAGKVCIKGTWFADCASGDYLGLAADDQLQEVYRVTNKRFGVSLCGTAMGAGGNRILHEMEERVAAHIGCEAAMAFPSCYQANTSLFSMFVGKDDRVIIDYFAHPSLVAGVKATGCFVVPFVHNDCDLLEKLLRQKGNLGKTVVVTESVFSTEGSIAPFNRINELCEQYGALPVIDDSHGIGVIGRNGAGILDYSEIYNYSGLYTASLGRAMANSGGIVAGRECVIEGLRYRCPGIVYSSGIAPAVAAGVIHVLDRIEQEYRAMRKRLQDNVEIFDTVLTCQGYPLSAGTAPVLAVQCGSRKNTLRFTHQLYASRILATPFVEPSVQLNCGIVRLIPGAGMSREACRAAAATIEAIVN